VTPVETDENFNADAKLRRKRSLDGLEVVHYRVRGLGQSFLFDLRPNNQLISPRFYVKRTGKDGSRMIDGEGWKCHYKGRLVSHGNGAVAMTTCNGLTGLMRTRDDDVIIEPVDDEVVSEEERRGFESARPHVIYKKRHSAAHVQASQGGGGKEERLQYCGKGRRHPVSIKESLENKTLRLLSNGEIRTSPQDDREDERVEAEKRFRRSALSSRRDQSEEREAGVVGKKRVETLVVADRKFIEKHKNDERSITIYILTIMNMVSSLFSDPSLENDVNVIIIGIVLLEDDSELDLSHRADTSLLNFCEWQHREQEKSGGKKADHSVLLTGIDICVNKNKPCGTLGLAQIGGMCRRKESCTINEDIGLGLAFTVAHETGHSLGMRHDGESSTCNLREGNIMSPTLNSRNGVFTWSQCSRDALRDFIRSTDSLCMDDGVELDDKFDVGRDEQPGQTYSAEEQCRWQFGNKTEMCHHKYKHGLEGICKTLWCGKGEVCETKYMPAAEGTKCGHNLWCRRGECVTLGKVPDRINGGWSQFDSWSSCTRTCGRGVRWRIRTCDSPKPQFGGIPCRGEDKQYDICNPQDCEPSTTTFREQQCSAFDSKPYRRSYYKWVPFTKFSTFGRGQCELLCKAEGFGFFDMLADQVIDGTPCTNDNNMICIQGKCLKVGCDNKINSNATIDACGVCNGDNSTCQIHTGVYDRKVINSGYYKVVRIPKGARKIEIREKRCCTHSYVAVKNTNPRNPKYFLNGNWAVNLHGDRKFAGSQWNYNRMPYHSESLSTDGPIDQDLIIEILVVTENPGILYSYTTRKKIFNQPRILMVYEHELAAPIETYVWNKTYSQCTKSCAGGSQTLQVSCLRRRTLKGVVQKEEVVSDYYCKSSEKPTVVSRRCNTQDCEARWASDNWGECSRSCGGGIKSRQVKCMRLTQYGDNIFPHYECDMAGKPQRTQTCQEDSCPAQWHTGPWSKCSRRCGRGYKHRTVFCQSGLHTMTSSNCDVTIKPKSRQRCVVRKCRFKKFYWQWNSWGQCSQSCDEGVKRRQLKCTYKSSTGKVYHVRSKRCKRLKKPKNWKANRTATCLVRECPPLTTTTTTTVATTTTTTVRPTTTTTTTTRPTTTTSTTTELLRRIKVSINEDRGAALQTSLTESSWITGNWQQCSVSCGGGFQMRIVRCLLFGRPSTKCRAGEKPPIRKTCNTQKCPTDNQNNTCVDNFKWCYLVPKNNQCGHRYFGKNCCKTCNESQTKTISYR